MSALRQSSRAEHKRIWVDGARKLQGLRLQERSAIRDSASDTKTPANVMRRVETLESAPCVNDCSVHLCVGAAHGSFGVPPHVANDPDADRKVACAGLNEQCLCDPCALLHWCHQQMRGDRWAATLRQIKAMVSPASPVAPP